MGLSSPVTVALGPGIPPPVVHHQTGRRGLVRRCRCAGLPRLHAGRLGHAQPPRHRPNTWIWKVMSPTTSRPAWRCVTSTTATLATPPRGRPRAATPSTTRWPLRGTVSTGFRAPSLQQEYYSSTAINFVSGPNGEVTPYTVRTFPVDDPAAQALGAQALKPEKSRNYSAGLVFTPLKRPVRHAGLLPHRHRQPHHPVRQPGRLRCTELPDLGGHFRLSAAGASSPTPSTRAPMVSTWWPATRSTSPARR